MKLRILTGSIVLLSALASFAEESQTAVAPTAPSQGQTSAPVAKVAPEAAAKKWKVGYQMRAFYDRTDADTNTGIVTNRNRFTFGYNLGPATVAIKPTWTNKYNVDNEVASVSAGDLILEAAKSGIKLNHDWSLTTTGRYYLPTSAGSRALASNGMLFGDLFFTRPIGTRLTALVEATYTKTFHNQRTAYAVKDATTKKPVKGKINAKDAPQNLPVDQISSAEGNARYDMYHLAGLEYKINKSWSFTQIVAFTNKYTYGNQAQGVSSSSADELEVMSYVTVEANKHLSIDFGLDQNRDSKARAAQPNYTFMADAETQYYLLANISL